MIEDEAWEILGFIEEDKIFIVLALARVFDREEISAGKKDDFLTEGKAREFIGADLYIRSKPSELFRYLRENILKKSKKASGGA